MKFVCFLSVQGLILWHVFARVGKEKSLIPKATAA